MLVGLEHDESGGEDRFKVGEVVDEELLCEHALFAHLFDVSDVVFGDSFCEVFADFRRVGTNLRNEGRFPLLLVGLEVLDGLHVDVHVREAEDLPADDHSEVVQEDLSQLVEFLRDVLEVFVRLFDDVFHLLEGGFDGFGGEFRDVLPLFPVIAFCAVRVAAVRQGQFFFESRPDFLRDGLPVELVSCQVRELLVDFLLGTESHVLRDQELQSLFVLFLLLRGEGVDVDPLFVDVELENGVLLRSLLHLFRSEFERFAGAVDVFVLPLQILDALFEVGEERVHVVVLFEFAVVEAGVVG